MAVKNQSSLRSEEKMSGLTGKRAVCIALVLEALIMIIKYSQLELAGHLYYPVSILFGSSFLLVALGLFLWLAKGRKEDNFFGLTRLIRATIAEILNQDARMHSSARN